MGIASGIVVSGGTGGGSGATGPINYTLTNPGGESGDMTGWTDETGTGFEIRNVSPAANSGSYYFGGGNQPEMRSYQDVTAANGAITTTEIDAGNVLIELAYYHGSFNGNDQVRMYADFYDGSPGSIISDIHKLPQLEAGPSASWAQKKVYYVLPANTRTIRLHMHGYRYDGAYCNAHIDDITLRGWVL